MSFDPKPWLEDFHQVLSEMSSHYANLEWAVEDRRMDLPRLRLDTEAKLREAIDEHDARRILDQFIASFGDGHLEIDWPTRNQKSTPPTSLPQSRCDRMGYHTNTHPGLDFSELLGFALLDSPESKLFPGGLLRLGNHKLIGIIRIGLFTEHVYPEICEEAVRQLKIPENADCGPDCENRIELATANLLTAALTTRANALRSAGASSLLVDITHNGGGSDWVDAAVRTLSSVPLHDSKIAFIKHEHWTEQLQDQLRDLQTDIKNHSAPPDLLNAAAHKLQMALDQSKQSCQTTDVWNAGKLNCSLLVKGLLFTSGVLVYAKPGSFAALESRTALFHPIRYAYTEDPNRLPLYVLVDRDTWSAAEYFAALLQDNHAATIVGEPTGGAGCGYTNGGIPAKLKNSSAQLKMPDCVRFRADGSNEVNGITPDVLLPWAERDSGFQRLKKLLTALESRQATTGKLRLQ